MQIVLGQRMCERECEQDETEQGRARANRRTWRAVQNAIMFVHHGHQHTNISKLRTLTLFCDTSRRLTFSLSPPRRPHIPVSSATTRNDAFSLLSGRECLFLPL